MTPELRTLAAFAEDTGSAASNHMATSNCPNSCSRGSNTLFWHQQARIGCIQQLHTCMQKHYTHKNIHKQNNVINNSRLALGIKKFSKIQLQLSVTNPLSHITDSCENFGNSKVSEHPLTKN